MAAAYALALGVALLCLAHNAMSHGGELHEWNWNTPGYNYTRVQLAVSNKLAYYNASESEAYLPGIIPYWPTKAPAATVAGNIQVWEFLDGGCKETVALVVNLQFTHKKTPISNSKLYVWGMTGNCEYGVMDLYLHNATRGASRGNLLWVGDGAVTNAKGVVSGTAPNIFFPRQTANANGPALRSLLVSLNPGSSPLLCADLVWQPYNAAAWAQKVATCKPSDAPSWR